MKPSPKTKRLIEKVARIRSSSRYEKLREQWRRSTTSGAEDWFPILVGFDESLWSRVLNVNLIEYYKDPEKQLQTQLMERIFWYQNMPDDSLPVGAGDYGWIYGPVGDVYVDFGVAFIPSLFGIEPVYRPNSAVWIGGSMRGGKSIIGNIEDVDALNFPDFDKDGLMPKAHEFYERFNKILDGRLTVSFPGWGRGPWGVAINLRGFNDLYADVIRQPELVHRLMNFVTECRLRYTKHVSNFFGLEIPKAVFHDDEINGDYFSRKTFEDFILPYEKKIADFHGGTTYYHSCGNMSKLLEPLMELKISKVDISAYTDLKAACESVDNDVVLQKRFHPTDVLNSTPKQIKSKVEEALTLLNGRKFELVADGFGTGPLTKIKQWLTVAKKARSGRFGIG